MSATKLEGAAAGSKDVPAREATAQRLLRSSLEHSYEPSLDIDWEAPLVDGLYGMPAHRVSLYGTDLWEQLTEEQRVTLSIHEVCSIARVGLWFEIILMQMLLRYAYDRDPRTQHIQYALTEVADECRHSVMFARMTERYGVPDYKPRWYAHNSGRLFKTIASGPAMFAGTLVAEEITDQLQREGMKDAGVQPLTRMVSKIHVTEEARHVRYAREELERLMPHTNGAQREVARWLTAIADAVTTDSGLNRERARLLAVGLVGLSQVTARYWLDSGQAVPRDEAVALMSGLAWRGLAGFPLIQSPE